MVPPSANTGASGAGAPHSCTVCLKQFPTRAALQGHINNPDDSYACSGCRIHYADIAAFRRHLELSHSGYMCTFGSCLYWSSEKADVEQHFSTHQEVPEHASGAVRARQFGSSENLRTEERNNVAKEEADGRIVTPADDRRAKEGASSATASSASSVGYTSDPQPVMCPLRVGVMEGLRGVAYTYCDKLHKDVPSLM